MYKYILKKKLKKHYKNNEREKRFLNLKDIHSILILFDTANYEEANIFVQKLKKLKKAITVYAYQDKKDGYDYSRTSYRIVTAKEVDDLFDNKIREIAKELDGTKFDAVIDLTTQRNASLEYLLAYSNASIKTGLKKNDLPQYDLSITVLPDIEKDNLKVRELAKQIVYYLHTINARKST
jgi:predicted MPP superfamily phosphohydrolase